MATVDTSSPVFMGDGMGMGGCSWIWLFAIFMLFGFGGFGGFGNGANGGYATSAEVQRGFDNQNTVANQREALAAITNGTAQSVAATNEVYHNLANAIQDKYGELTRDFGALQVAQTQALANQNECCGQTKLILADGFAQTNMNIAQNRYDAALNTAAINANATAIGQKILDKLSEGENRALQNRVNQLELKDALSGVVRYQPNFTYGAVPSPLCNCGGGYPLYN